MDKMKNVHVINRISRVTGVVPENHLNHPVLGADLEEVRNGKQRGRLSEIIKDSPQSATRVTNAVTPDKDKED